MLTKILVPLDGSPLAEVALPHAERLARLTGARVLLLRAVSVHPLPGQDAIDAQYRAAREAERYLERTAAPLMARGIAIETTVPYGDAVEWIAEETCRHRADLIVMATHGRSGLGRWVFGSVAAAALARVAAPVLLVRAWETEPRPEPAGRRRRILLPLDGSPFAEEALPLVTGLARGLEAELVLVRAVPIPPSSIMAEPLPASVADDELERDLAAAQEYLEQLAERLGCAGVRAHHQARVGGAAAVVATVAREQGADLTVMATHGRTGARRALLGSVADAVLRRGDTPLLLVRPQAFRDPSVPAGVTGGEAAPEHGGPHQVG